MICTSHQYRQMYRTAKLMKLVGMSVYAATMLHRATGWDMAVCHAQVARL